MQRLLLLPLRVTIPLALLVLAVATLYPERIVGAIDVVGISHFGTFLENTEDYRRDLRRAEYGDVRDPKMRAFMEKVAPLNNAAKIKAALGSDQLGARPGVVPAYAASASALIAVLSTMVTQIEVLAGQQGANVRAFLDEPRALNWVTAQSQEYR